MTPLPLNVLYFGKEERLPERKELRAGLLSVTIEQGDLISVCWGEHELLRRIYAAVRDQNWGTVPCSLSGLQVQSDSDSFTVSYRAEHRQGSIDFVWDATIRGTAEGTLVFGMDGQARSTFLRNRIGFCLLHSAGAVAGVPFVVEQDDGSSVHGLFPKSIATQQPLPGTERMKALAFEAAPGLRTEIQFSGDLFQMEDQRNWTDATLKTFCTPLSMPTPVEVREGTRMSQRITLKVVDSRASRPILEKESRTTLTIGETVSERLPRLGLGMASDGQPLSEGEIARLKALHLSHLRVDLHLSDPRYPAILAQAASQAQQLGARLEAALFLSSAAENELRLLSEELLRLQPPIKTWLIFHIAEKTPSEKWVGLARRTLTSWNREALFGSGTNSYFYQLSQAPASSGVDFLCYSIHPQEHAFDNHSLVETLEVQGETVHNARAFARKLPIAISPVTLKPRFNPNATGALSSPPPGELPPEVDVRQMSLFGAAWTVGSLKSLAESRAFSVTYYETAGWRGVMERQAGSPLPERFLSLPGSVFPLYHVLADVAEFRNAEVLAARSSHPLKVTGLALVQAGSKRLLLANLTNAPQVVSVEGLSGPLRTAELNEHSVIQAMMSPGEFRSQLGHSVPALAGKVEVTLLPYAVTRLDEERE